MTVLDPHIYYQALKAEYDDDIELSIYLDTLKSDLQDYFNTYYASSPITQPSHAVLSEVPVTDTSSSGSCHVHGSHRAHGSPQKNFVSHFQHHQHVVIDELEQFWALPQDDFDTCNPIHWWCQEWVFQPD